MRNQAYIRKQKNFTHSLKTKTVQRTPDKLERIKAIQGHEHKYTKRLKYLAQNTEIILCVYKLDVSFYFTLNDRTKTGQKIQK